MGELDVRGERGTVTGLCPLAPDVVSVEANVDQHPWKERACLLAAKRGMALYSRGHHVYGIYSDGTTVLICGGSLGDAWVKACKVLSQDHDLRVNRPARYTLQTRGGLIEASSWVELLWLWFLGKKSPLRTLVEER